MEKLFELINSYKHLPITALIFLEAIIWYMADEYLFYSNNFYSFSFFEFDISLFGKYLVLFILYLG
jgi:hypothetical protein